ncbi:thiamine ABC transporter ATP-binding protein [Aliihoeflea sp. 40Bstr573]|uniref:thiamine ABC transporter ATP-binding protein n=1 Tax=Aliihoeflea sp. 40Bstr573 TaxID=2696467 RepID=UPI002095EAAE|nr:thiamine ABC transporter ATP-binding protein [Aliihoeflea sp. 40Bstr573]MCO6388224.1 thiamine ABC transporter ATP-binding protein [Aliihoeflea sp. 40Bstr573]
MTGAQLQLDQVRFAYPGGAVMRFDIDIAAGSVVALLGASGSGKSTLLHLVAGFEAPQGGRILIERTDVTELDPAKRPVSMVFQENNLFHHLSVAQNVGLGRSPGLRLSGQDRTDIAEALADVGLAGKEERLPSELSGGERQRVAIARALVRQRPLLLLDEPFASLGPALRADMVELVRALASKTGMTIVFVTHQPEDARALAGRIIFLADGTVAADGPAETFFGPDAPSVFSDYAGRLPTL